MAKDKEQSTPAADADQAVADTGDELVVFETTQAVTHGGATVRPKIDGKAIVPARGILPRKAIQRLVKQGKAKLLDRKVPDSAKPGPLAD